MSDSRTLELERRALEGDPDAQVGLVLTYARNGWFHHTVRKLVTLIGWASRSEELLDALAASDPRPAELISSMVLVANRRKWSESGLVWTVTEYNDHVSRVVSMHASLQGARESAVATMIGLLRYGMAYTFIEAVREDYDLDARPATQGQDPWPRSRAMGGFDNFDSEWHEVMDSDNTQVRIESNALLP